MWRLVNMPTPKHTWPVLMICTAGCPAGLWVAGPLNAAAQLLGFWPLAVTHGVYSMPALLYQRLSLPPRLEVQLSLTPHCGRGPLPLFLCYLQAFLRKP